MTQKDLQLLIVDLSGRVPYGLKVSKKIADYDSQTFKERVGELWDMGRTGSNLVNVDGIDYRSFSLDFKPFLRSMSKMTPEEDAEYERLKMCGDEWKLVDFFNSHHINYRLPKRLYKEARKGMYQPVTK